MAQLAKLTLAHDSLLPRAPGGQGPGAALSMVVHVGLIAALTTSIDWRTRAPEVFSAEIWAAVPQAAAPAPVEAPPPPPPPPPAPVQRTALPPAPDADIAIEQERKRKAELAERELAERKRLEADRKLAEAERKRLADEKKLVEQQEREAKAEKLRQEKQREDYLRRVMGQAGGAASAGTGSATSTGTAARSAGPSASYAAKVIAAVRPHIFFAGNVPGNAATEVEVRATAGGSIMSRSLVKTSGHTDWDAAVLLAIDKTPRLPPDTDGRVPEMIVIVFRRD